jgi:hypothetical protein
MFKNKFIFLFILFLSFLIYSIKNFYNKNYKINFPNEIENNNNKIIAVIFAGRKKYLEILMIYLNYLNKINKIHEIHFWQYTKNIQDIKYLESISNIHKTSSNFIEYREIFPEIFKNYFIIGIMSSKGGAYLLLNNKYEIFFNINKTLFKNINTNETKLGEGIKIPNYTYLYYKIEINNFTLLIKNENKILFKHKIEDNNFFSIKIHSEKYTEIFWDYKEIKNKNIKLFDTEYRASKINWYETYKFYLTYEFEILLKIDDDILYIDINRFDEYINFIRTNKNINITIPNLINHAVSFFYNIKFGLIPKNIIRKKYLGKKSSLDFFKLFKDGTQAVLLHKYFLNNTFKFINNNINPINLTRQKPSICMFGILKENYIKVYNSDIIGKICKKRNKNNQIINFDDEKYTYRLKNNYIYPRFVCVHYQFGPQIKRGLTEKLINNYKNLIISTLY